MKSCGIIAEYNPFHNGHRYHLQEARKQSGSEVMVVVMSGNFTQRGEPAIFDKWTRAEMALLNGADLVVEQSVLGSVQSADLFAKSGVRLLQQLRCDTFSFGAENGSSEDFMTFANAMVTNEAEIDDYFQSIRNDGRSYPVQMQEAIAKVIGSLQPDFSFWEPNNQLGLAYLKENILSKHIIRPVVVKRRGAGHHDQLDDERTYASGTALRELLLQPSNGTIRQWVPENTLDLSTRETKVTWEHLWPLLRYRLIIEEPASLRELYQVSEGIEHRLKAMVHEATSFAHFIRLVKNKRWTWVRLQRVCLAILLDIKTTDVNHFFGVQPVVRILGFTQNGQRYLRHLKKENEGTFITNVNQKNDNYIKVDIRADRIYQAGMLGKEREQNYTRQPIRLQ